MLSQYKQIFDTIDYESDVEGTLSLRQLAMTPVARKRVPLAINVAVFSTISGRMNR